MARGLLFIEICKRDERSSNMYLMHVYSSYSQTLQLINIADQDHQSIYPFNGEIIVLLLERQQSEGMWLDCNKY